MELRVSPPWPLQYSPSCMRTILGTESLGLPNIVIVQMPCELVSSQDHNALGIGVEQLPNVHNMLE